MSNMSQMTLTTIFVNSEENRKILWFLNSRTYFLEHNPIFGTQPKITSLALRVVTRVRTRIG